MRKESYTFEELENKQHSQRPKFWSCTMERWTLRIQITWRQWGILSTRITWPDFLKIELFRIDRMLKEYAVCSCLPYFYYMSYWFCFLVFQSSDRKLLSDPLAKWTHRATRMCTCTYTNRHYQVTQSCPQMVTPSKYFTLCPLGTKISYLATSSHDAWDNSHYFNTVFKFPWGLSNCFVPISCNVRAS